MSLPLPMIPRLRTVASLLLAMLSVLASLLPVQANDERDMLERREVREAGDRAGKERRDAQRLSEESAKRSRDESSAREADKTETRTDGGSVAKSEAKAETKSEAKGGDAGKSGGERGKDAAKRAEDQARDEARDGDDGDKDRDKDKNAEKARREAAGSNGRDGDRYRIERGVDGRERLRGEVLMIGRADAVARVRAEGYAVRSEQPLSVLGESVLRLEVRPGESVEQAVQHLQSIVPAASIAPNHVYRPSQGGALARPSTVAAANPALTPAAAMVDLGQAIGILDTGVELATPQLAGAVLASRSFAGGPYTPRPHGTLVAEIAAAQGARLAVADVFGADADNRLVASADAIAAAVAWLISERVTVINISIEGPDNGVMALLVQRATAAGIVVVAAAGNGGPAAAPVYPAAYAGVIAVTAIDERDQVYRRANRGAHISFAAAGVNVVSAAGSYDRKPVSGTSFAAPRVAAVIAQRLAAARSAGSPARPSVVLAELRHGARDLGAAGRDTVYGWGALEPGASAAVELGRGGAIAGSAKGGSLLLP